MFVRGSRNSVFVMRMLSQSGLNAQCLIRECTIYLTLQSVVVVFSLLPGSTVLNLGDVGSNQFDISALRAGG